VVPPCSTVNGSAEAATALPVGASLLVPVRVLDVSLVSRRGAHSFMTGTGLLVVDGVAASSYADYALADGRPLSTLFVAMERIHDAHHAFLAPLRWVYALFGAKTTVKLNLALGTDFLSLATFIERAYPRVMHVLGITTKV
jgi:hypothetical protein